MYYLLHSELLIAVFYQNKYIVYIFCHSVLQWYRILIFFKEDIYKCNNFGCGRGNDKVMTEFSFFISVGGVSQYSFRTLKIYEVSLVMRWQYESKDVIFNMPDYLMVHYCG